MDFPIGLDDIDKLLRVFDFLDNTKELLEDFKPEVGKYLVKKDFFKGPFRVSYNKMFDELIQSLIRKEVVKHFEDFTPEEIMLITDMELLKLTASGLFNQDAYAPTEREKNESNSLH